jgi:AcrR family transcriptional regulator
VSSARRPGQRAGLTRAQVLDAARGLLAENGLEAVTMRGLAQRLGVSPNALYSHVSSKTALVDEILDDALGTVDTPDAENAEPITGLHILMTSSYRTLLEHADLIPLYLARQGARGPNAQRLGDVAVSLLARRGVSETRAREALHVLIVYTIGSAAFSARAPIATNEETTQAAGRHAARFDQGLRWLLAGIDAALVTRAR